MRRIDVFLRGIVPLGELSPNRGERKEGRVPIAIGKAKRSMRELVQTMLLQEADVVAVKEPFERAHVYLALRTMSAQAAGDGRFYRPDDAGNACYALKAAIDGIADAGLVKNDSYRHVPLLTTSVERCATRAEEGLGITVIELEPLEAP